MPRSTTAPEGGEHERIDDEPALHVGDPGSVGAGALDVERAAAGLALGEHGVAVAHEHDRALVGPRVVEPHVDGRAVGLIGLGGGHQAVLLEERDEAPPHGVDAGLVVAAAVDVHELGQEGQHGLLLRAEPLGDLCFSRGQSGHASPLAVRARGCGSARRRKACTVAASAG